MDTKLAFLVVANLLTGLSSTTSDPFWNLLSISVQINDAKGVVNGTADGDRQLSNELQWNFATEIGQGHMIRLTFLTQGNYELLTLTLGGAETFVKTGVACYYFTRPEQTDSRCQATAKYQGCGFVNLNTTHLNLFYNSLSRPGFIFSYEYFDCLGNSLYSRSTPQTTTNSQSVSTTSTTSTTTTTTNLPITTRYSSPTIMTTTIAIPVSDLATTNSTVREIDNRAGNPDVTTQETGSPSTVKTNGQTAGIDKNIIIIIAVVAILVVLIVIVLLICGKRFRRYHKQLKELHSGKFSNVGNSEAPPIDPLYEEIAPKLPSRNVNMKEPGYEVPLCSMGSAPEESSQGESSQTVENELYLKRMDGETEPTSQNGPTKYGSVENELYHEDNEADDEINANVVTKGVTLTNELYTTSNIDAPTNHRQDTMNVANTRPLTPQASATADTEIEVNDSSTVNNVLYNM